MTKRRTTLLVLLLVVLLAALLLPAAATADDDVRRDGVCTGRSEVTLRLDEEDDEIRIELEIETARPGTRWTVILLHERRIAFRGRLRSRGDHLRLRRTVPDYFGSDTVLARATGPGGETCRVSATI